MASVKTEDGADFFLEMVDNTGVAVTSVSDGHVFAFTKSHLEGMLAAINKAGSDKAIIFVKRADKASTN